MRPVDQDDLFIFEMYSGRLMDGQITISISEVDLKQGSPRVGDMIARNPKNHLDQWLVAEQYFKENFESFYPFVEDTELARIPSPE